MTTCFCKPTCWGTLKQSLVKIKTPYIKQWWRRILRWRPWKTNTSIHFACTKVKFAPYKICTLIQRVTMFTIRHQTKASMNNVLRQQRACYFVRVTLITREDCDYFESRMMAMFRLISVSKIPDPVVIQFVDCIYTMCTWLQEHSSLALGRH